MREKLRKKITSAFEVARQEGQLRRELDVTADVDDVMAWIEEEGYTRQPEPPGETWSDRENSILLRNEERERAARETRQPEYEPVDKVKAIEDALRGFAQATLDFVGDKPAYPIDYWKDKIISLFPEYEPVELEALTDEEIQPIIIEGNMKYSHLDIPLRRQAIDRNISQETIRKNQKRHLYQVKEELPGG